MNKVIKLAMGLSIFIGIQACGDEEDPIPEHVGTWTLVSYEEKGYPIGFTDNEIQTDDTAYFSFFGNLPRLVVNKDNSGSFEQLLTLNGSGAKQTFPGTFTLEGEGIVFTSEALSAPIVMDYKGDMIEWVEELNVRPSDSLFLFHNVLLDSISKERERFVNNATAPTSQAEFDALQAQFTKHMDSVSNYFLDTYRNTEWMKNSFDFQRKRTFRK